MNYSEIVDALNHATGFDLFRLRAAIDKMLDEPSRVKQIINSIKKDQHVQYFDADENRIVEATVIDIKRTRVAVRRHDNQACWTIPYYFINANGVATDIVGARKIKGMSRNELKIGDKVGFIARDNEERYGDVIRLNQKTVTLNTSQGQWRVSYTLLFAVLDPDHAALGHIS